MYQSGDNYPDDDIVIPDQLTLICPWRDMVSWLGYSFLEGTKTIISVKNIMLWLPVPAIILFKFAVPVVFKLRISKV